MIDQAQVNLFADATGDHQWIHVDPERAASGPFGAAIAHGYLTLSIIPSILHEVIRVEGFKFGVNYGCNKVRFPSPVKVGSKLRLGAAVASVESRRHPRRPGRARHHHRDRGRGQAVVRGPGGVPLHLVGRSAPGNGLSEDPGAPPPFYRGRSPVAERVVPCSL